MTQGLSDDSRRSKDAQRPPGALLRRNRKGELYFRVPMGGFTTWHVTAKGEQVMASWNLHAGSYLPPGTFARLREAGLIETGGSGAGPEIETERYPTSNGGGTKAGSMSGQPRSRTAPGRPPLQRTVTAQPPVPSAVLRRANTKAYLYFVWPPGSVHEGVWILRPDGEAYLCHHGIKPGDQITVDCFQRLSAAKLIHRDWEEPAPAKPQARAQRPTPPAQPVEPRQPARASASDVRNSPPKRPGTPDVAQQTRKPTALLPLLLVIAVVLLCVVGSIIVD